MGKLPLPSRGARRKVGLGGGDDGEPRQCEGGERLERRSGGGFRKRRH